MNVQQHKKIHNEGVMYTRNLILRGMTAIYLVAFLSFYYQSPGLFGNNGILPARIQIEGPGHSINSVNAIHNKPTLLHLSSYLGIDTEYMIDVLALLGSLISFTGLLSQKMCVLPIFAALWSLYFSLVQIAQSFINQSDQLLLEVGIVLIIMAPVDSKRPSPTDRIAFILLRWILIRFMFESGAVKIGSYCPYWWSFTGMSRHFETMPLPTPMAWFSHNLPASWLKLTNIFTNLSELVCVWFFFFPHRRIRRYAFYWQLFLQMYIILTGNYGFLNFMIVILLLCLLDDKYFFEKGTKGFTVVIRMFVYTVVYIILCYLFGDMLDNNLTFKEGYLEMLRTTIKPAPLMALVLLIATFLSDIVSHPTITYAQTIAQKLYAVNTLIAFTFISGALITLSMVPHGNLDVTTNITNSELGKFYQQANKFYIVNEYGRHLRKMRADRIEIVYEHSQNIDGPWKEYEFRYKPSNVNQSLPFTGFYLPRLDFQFYEAAATSYRNQLWTVSVAYRLLQNEPNTLRLFGLTSNILPAPKYIRASIFKFTYTSSYSSRTYWKRKRMGEYIPPFSIDNGILLSHLRSIKISTNYKEPPIKNQFLKTILDLIRYQINLFEGSFLIFSVLAAGIAINVTIKRKNN